MASKSFQVSIDFIGNISDLQSKIKQVTGEISKIGATSGGMQVQKQFEQLVKTVTDLQTRASQPIGSKAEFNKLASEVSKANMTYGQLMGTIERLQSLGGAKLLEFLPKGQQNNIKQATQAVKEFEEAQKAAQKAMGKKSKDQTDYSNLQSQAQSAAQKVEELEAKWKKAISAKDRYFKKENVIGKEKELASLESRERDLVTQSKRKAGLSETQAGELDQVRNRISEIKAELASIKADPLVKSAEEATAALSKAKDASNKLNNDVKNFKISDDGVKQYEQAFEQLKQKAAQLGVQVSDIGNVDNVQTLLNRLNQLESDGFIEGAQAAQQYANTIRSILDPAFKQMETGMNGVNQSWGQFMTAQEDMSMLQNRLKYFFSLTNSIQLLKRTITSAMNTVKELDAVMTETAVVTDFTVGDMWDKLPEYADQASALGASIKDLYSATTLYYQQGLNSEQAMSVGVETMKMARIAGMDAAEATKAMTAALRGFNMEISEASATRVNDVYSELAAITAADTEQIATAMSKTASIADSANMEFETTAALLAQIIETTQEAPETAGTAMKTIIARFTEVKKLFDEGMLSGEDSEGEAIEINKIDAALRKVGISLTDFLKGEKGIDDIFLELASKWDTLDLATQRYIATTAAGSRQQSRFIAMMSNYDRTMELVTAANNSAGASQEQFEKTLDSMEAKLQKLKNAWNEFTMGIANNEILKGGIDLLTGLLETINKLTDALSGGSGLGKSFVNLLTIIGALKGGKSLLQKGFMQAGVLLGTRETMPVDQKQLNAFQRASQAAKYRTGFKNKVGGYFTGLFTSDLTQDEAAELVRKKATHTRGEAAGLEWKASQADPAEAQALEQQAKAANEAADAQEKFANSMKGAVPVTQQQREQLNQLLGPTKATTVNLQAAGAAAMLAGGAFGLLATVLENNGMEDGANACRVLSAALTGLGGVLMMLPMILGGSKIAIQGWKLAVLDASGANAIFTASLGWIAVAIVAVIAVVWLLVAAFKAIHAASPEGKLEAATKAANDAAEAAENAAQAYEHLASALDSIGGKSAALENLAVGTTEWKNAVQELNGEVLDLVEQYPELAQFIKTENGVLSFSNQRNAQGKTVEDILNEYQNSSILAQSAKAAANIQKQYAQSLVDYQKTIGEIFAFKEIEVQKGEWKRTSTYNMPGQAGLTWVPETDPEGNVITETTTQKTFLGKKLTDKIAQAIVTGMVDYESGKDEENITINLEGEIYSFTAEDFGELKEYGNTLMAAEAATQAYAQAILANAAAISDIPEQTRENMSDFWAPKQVEGLTFKNKDAILKDGISDEELDKYAKNAGYTRVGRNLYKGEALSTNKIDWDEESVATALAGIQTSKDISELMLKQRANIGAMSSNNLAVFKAISGQNLDDLTISQLGEINTEKALEMVGNLGYKKEADYAKDFGYEDIMASTITDNEAEGIKAAYKIFNKGATEEEAQTWLQNQIDTNSYISAAYAWLADVIKLQEEAETNKGKITEEINTIAGGEKDSGWLESNLAQASYSTIKGLEDQTSQMALEDAKTYLQAFAESIANNKELSQDTQQALSSYLSNVDWPDMSQAINAMDYMQQMGLDPNVIKEFWNIATDGANTYMSSMSQVLALTEKFQGKIKQVDEIEEALEGGKATNEQMQQLIDAGVDVSNFELTVDGWKATGEQIEEATRKLREYNAEQARAAVDRQAEEIEEMRQGISKFGLYLDEDGALQASNYALGRFKGAIQRTDSGEVIAGTVSEENAFIVSSLLGLTKKNEETNNDFVARLQAALNDFISGLNNAESIQIMLDKAAALAEAAVYTTDENVQRGGSAESVRMSMQQEAKDLGLDSEEVTKYAEAVQNAKDLTSQTAAQIAIDYARMAQGMEEITSKWDEWKEKISMDNDMEKAVAFEEMATSANKMLGTIDVLDAEFLKLEGSMELVQQAAKGDADAFNKLQKIAGKILTKKIKEAGEGIQEVEEITGDLQETLENFDDSKIEIGEVLELNDSDIDQAFLANQLTNMYNQAVSAAMAGGADLASAMAQANALMESQGYEPPEMEEKVETITTMSPPGFEAAKGASVQDSTGASHWGIDWKVKDPQEMTYTYTRLVPKEGSGYTKKAESPSAKTKSGGGGGGGGGSEWKNPIDKLYNVQENIDRTVREREQIERRYQRLLDRRLATAQELQRVSQDEIESLKEQAEYQQQMVDGRRQMLQDEMEENAELKKYATVNVETGQITIDWELINSVTDEEEGSAIEDYLSKLEELRDSMHEAQDALEDINDAVWEIEERGREEYLEWEERIKEAYVEVRQKEIDTLEEINESINDTNDKLLDSIQQSIDKMRQDRENERTEEDLQEKQRRLAYLEQDTSNANAMEILELRKEIEEGQEDYTDTLIDQKISELQEQNDKAAEQREKQITLLQNQLDWEIESGRIWQVVEALMQDGLNPQGGLIRGSMLEQILKDGEQWTGLSDIGQMNWLLDLETMVAESMNWRMTKGQLENLHEKKTDQEIEFINSKGEKLTGTADEKGQVWTGKDTYYKDVYQWIDGTYHTTESAATKYEAPKPEESKTSTGSSKKKGGGKTYPYQAIVDGVPLKGSYSTPEEAAAAVAKAIETNGGKGSGEVTNYTSGETKGRVVEVEGEYFTDISGEIEKIKKYKTGGLADFTGPAWLDGTKSRPELVLNQRDTQNFIQLKDILSSIMSHNIPATNTSTENNGDFSFDIDINVESLQSDYDVEQVASKVKSMIVDNARYRNNNAISLTR